MLNISRETRSLILIRDWSFKILEKCHLFVKKKLFIVSTIFYCLKFK